MKMNQQDRELLDRYFLGQASDAEIGELEERLLADPDLRQRYLHDAMAEADLRSFALREENVVEVAREPERGKSRLKAMALLGLAAAALVFLIGMLVWPTSVGTIVSSEMAGWQSAQPTVEGASFGPGVYVLQTGVATLAFQSGAEMVMEAPAKIEIVSDMEVIFDYGQASFTVPEQAIGFRVDTRYGSVIDHGTRFSIQLRQHEEEARLAVHEGEIAIHHRGGEVQHLVTDESAQMDELELRQLDDPSAEGALESKAPVLALSSRGRETSIIYSNQRGEKLRPDMLMVKFQQHSNHVNRRAFLAFDVSQIDLEQIAEARLILNAVPTGMGHVTDMPKVSEFVLYGIPDDERENWPRDGMRWNDAPKVEEATALATFQMHRARQRGVVSLDTAELLAFLQTDRSGEVSFMIDCKTPGASLVHGFASSLHREAAGPVLELVMKNR